MQKNGERFVEIEARAHEGGEFIMLAEPMGERVKQWLTVGRLQDVENAEPNGGGCDKVCMMSEEGEE